MTAALAADPVPAFRLAMKAHGLALSGPILPDGQLHRFHVEGDRQTTRNGWYVLYPDDPPAAAFGCWRRDISVTWCARSEREMGEAERRRLRRRMEENRKAREDEKRQLRENTARRARKLWAEARPANPAHPYLRRKGVRPHGIRQDGERLLIPVSSYGEIHGLQFIDPHGGKRFLRGTPKRGRYHSIGTSTGTILIAEGYATAATVHEATGHAAAVAFDCGNLKPVAEALRAKFPRARIILAGDNDRDTEGNPGVRYATEAARAVNGLLALPDFADGGPGTDWNDVAIAPRGAV